jgi:hypothetical protein
MTRRGRLSIVEIVADILVAFAQRTMSAAALIKGNSVCSQQQRRHGHGGQQRRKEKALSLN